MKVLQEKLYTGTRKLCHSYRRFPAKTADIVSYAKLHHYGPDTMLFLGQFYPDHEFQSRADLINRLDELAFMGVEKQDMPSERLRSLQD